MSETVAKGTKCCALMFRNYHYHRCERNASVLEDGKAYCKQHAPSSVKARTEERTAKYNEEIAAKRQERERTKACVEALRGIPSESLAGMWDDIEKLAIAYGYHAAMPCEPIDEIARRLLRLCELRKNQ